MLSAAGRGQFGALGVTWSTQAPNLTHPPLQPEDDLGRRVLQYQGILFTVIIRGQRVPSVHVRKNQVVWSH